MTIEDQLIIDIYSRINSYLETDVDEDLKNEVAIWIAHFAQMMLTNNINQLKIIISDRIKEIQET